MADKVNRSNAQRPNSDYKNVIDRIAVEDVCPFCPENFRKYHELPIIIDGNNWFVTENKYPYPQSREHLLIVHKAHIETVEELTIAAWAELSVVVKDVCNFRKILGATLLMRFGQTMFNGASVAHLHAHLVSGTGDTSQPVVTRVG
jgi:diadenosine tetraphosphate (Ap4A) HIT family hydrolase